MENSMLNSHPSPSFEFNSKDLSLNHAMHAYHYTLEDFDIGAYLGDGGYGNVFLARERRSGYICVLKAISKAHLARNNQEAILKKEIELQAHLKHPHICSVYTWFECSSTVFIVIEYCYNGDLFNYMEKNNGRFEEPTVAQMLFEITWAFRTCHDKRIAHFDLKPENVFVDHKGGCKLADFGLSAHIGSLQKGKVNIYRGTYDYWSPEQVARALSDANSHNVAEFGFKTDIWSLGVLAFELYFGFPPFGSTEDFHPDGRVGAEKELKRRIMNDRWDSYAQKRANHLLQKITPQFRKFLDVCLAKKPDDRPNSDILLTKSPFFNKYQSHRLNSKKFTSQPRGNNAMGHFGFNHHPAPWYTPALM